MQYEEEFEDTKGVFQNTKDQRGACSIVIHPTLP
jgi:hypothetical protein